MLDLACHIADCTRCPCGVVGPLRASAVSQVVCNFELYGDKLDAAHLPEQLGELSLPTPSLPAEDHLQRLPLALVGPFVDEQPQRRLGFSSPRIALEGGQHDEAQAVQPDVAVVSLEDALLLDYRHIHTDLARPYRRSLSIPRAAKWDRDKWPPGAGRQRTGRRVSVSSGSGTASPASISPSTGPARGNLEISPSGPYEFPTVHVPWKPGFREVTHGPPYRATPKL